MGAPFQAVKCSNSLSFLYLTIKYELITKYKDGKEVGRPSTGQADRKYQVIWPIQETFSMDLTGFQIIYPSYIDSNKTVKMGRRLSKEESVPTPTVTDISYALQKLSVRHAVQPYKGYSRDVSCQWDNPGRVLVDVPTTMIVPEGATTENPKKLLMKELANIIPDLPYRIERLKREAEEEKVKQEEQKKLQAAANSSAQAAAAKKNASKAATSNKKKNKGKKKK
ncbi:SEC65 subunit [Seminavis robusta]|uniref:SEC65 subunit n=1 Tax=Seminavis robusta TaxID=568900 RepID=A0A9N8DQS3_9STRA|nr:SEC65 subunit [Seminavis robusta]|eukprot:Sro288_g108880.1 SEC65 subunit (224) ;mRNA; r:61188-62041